MPKKVLLFTDSHSFCGVGQFNADILEALSDAGYDALCAQRKENTPLQERLAHRGIQYHWFAEDPEISPNAFANDRITHAATIAKIRPDAIIFSIGHPQFLFAAIEAARFFQIPYVIRLGLVTRSLLPTGADQIAVFQQQYHRAQAVICMSEENRQLLSEYFSLPKDLCEIIPPGVRDDFFLPLNLERRRALRQEWNIPENAVVAVSVARLQPVKGHNFQLSALKRLSQQSPPKTIYLLWAGQGALQEELEKQVSESGLADQIRFLGHIWNVPEVLDAADIFVLTSHAEGLPHAIVEAMAKGLPVIATDVGGAKEVLTGIGEVIAEPSASGETVEELVEALNRWIEHPEERRQAGLAGRNRAMAKFRHSDNIAAYLQHVSAAVGQ